MELKASFIWATFLYSLGANPFNGIERALLGAGAI